ncbi:unnamed protein product, partial [Timema podura]|nr:unnamed protein product [Timema podura]
MSINHRKSLLSHSSAIMESIDSLTIAERSLPPDIIPEGDSCSLGPSSEDTSFHLIDGKEYLKITSAEQFVKRLKCEKSDRVKVVSIFGNTGDGKSFTLNHTFFEGRTVFQTSCKQDSCTLGVWAAFDPLHSVICLDTEGLLGATNHENQRTRLLLKRRGLTRYTSSRLCSGLDREWSLEVPLLLSDRRSSSSMRLSTQIHCPP